MSDAASDDVAPLGTIHPKGRCWRCGDGRDRELVVVRATRAWGWQCADSLACERRYAQQRQLALFGVRS